MTAYLLCGNRNTSWRIRKRDRSSYRLLKVDCRKLAWKRPSLNMLSSTQTVVCTPILTAFLQDSGAWKRRSLHQSLQFREGSLERISAFPLFILQQFSSR